MRCVVVALLGLGLAQPALAADMGILRGSSGFGPPARYQNWEGAYVGGAAGVGAGGANFDGAGGSVVNSLIANTNLEGLGVQSWSTAGQADTGHAAQYGGFVGYNAQWGDVVLGLEASYYHTSLSANSGGRTPAGGTFILEPDGSFYSIPTAVSGQSFISLTDFGTLRARAGWSIDRFLPYLTGGVALGRASFGSTATLYQNTAICVVANCTSPPITNPWLNDSVRTASDGRSNALIYGWSAGFGMDVALTQNIFLRGEYEFIQFSQMRLNLNSARAGVGLKF